MPVEWLAGFTHRHVTNRNWPRRAQLGFSHTRTVNKVVLHTTEGHSAEAAFAAYDARAGLYSGGVHPHLTVDPFRLKRYQHVPLTKASYSLKRGDADGVIQIEIVGWADYAWTDAQLDWLGAQVLGPVLAACPKIPPIVGAPFLSASAGLLARPWPHGKARLSPSAWANAEGVLGHQHAPYDDHWDPGGMNVARMLRAATGSEEDSMILLHDSDSDTWRVAVPGEGSAVIDSPAHWVEVIAEGRKTGVYSSPYLSNLIEKIRGERG